MKHAGTQFLFSYWDHLRNGRSAPDRRDIDLASIRPVLADTFLLEVDETRRFNLSLSGDRVTTLFQRNLKGHSFLERWAVEDRAAVRRTLDSVIDGVIPALLGAHGAPGERTPLPLEILLLPMRNFGKTHSRILGLVTPSASPSWLGLVPIEPLRLTSLRLLGPSAVTATEPVTSERRSRPVTRVGHLRVFEGGKSGKESAIA
jgi:hypothetical protein